jgi:hypothetical protein
VVEPSAKVEGLQGLDAQKIFERLNLFTDLADSEKEMCKSLIDGLVEYGYSTEHLLKACALYRNTEGAAFYGYTKRLKSLVTADKFEAQGVHLPLDVEVSSSDRKIKIYLPEDLDTCIDNGIIHDLIRYSTATPSVSFDRTSGPLVSSDREGQFFVMGYITEILSDQKIERISYTKGASYQIGRMCARTKTLLSVLDQQKVPTKFLKVPARYLGGTMQFKEPEIIRALQSYFRSDEVPHLRRLLEALLEHTIRCDKSRVEGKIGKGVFLPTSETLHVFKRKTRKTVRSSKRGGNTTIVEALDPTKPSQLATVAPWEREAVSEVYEHPWTALKELSDSFDQEEPMSRDYNRFGKKISELIERQWQAKQRLLRSTKHRQEGYTGNRGDPLFKKLNWVRDTLTQFATIEGIPRDALSDFSPYQILPSLLSKGEELSPTAPEVLFKDRRMAVHFPQVDRLLQTWENFTSSLTGEQSPVKKEEPER